MTEILGNFIETHESEEYLIMGFSPGSTPIQQRWRNNGLSADFIADYWATFFPASDGSSKARQIEIKHAVAYIANELLENAMKFSYASPQCPISITLNLYSDDLRFYVSNHVQPEAVERFKRYIRQLLSEDLSEMYMNQLEKNASQDDSGTESRLGFLTMLMDYDVELAWKFEADQDNPEMITVTTMVKLKI